MRHTFVYVKDMKETVYDLLILKNTEIWPTSNFERKCLILQHHFFGPHPSRVIWWIYLHFTPPRNPLSYPSWPKKKSAIDFVDTQTLCPLCLSLGYFLSIIEYKLSRNHRENGWISTAFTPQHLRKVLSWRLPWPTCGRSPQGVHVDPENTDTIAIGWLKEQKGLKLEVAGKNMDLNDNERFKGSKILICWCFPGSFDSKNSPYPKPSKGVRSAADVCKIGPWVSVLLNVVFSRASRKP